MADTPRRRRRTPIAQLLADDSIVLDARAATREEAVRMTGELLVATGAVRPAYIEAMLAREHSVSTYVGEGIAFPHATSAETGDVLCDAITVMRFVEPVEWNGDSVHVAIGIAAEGRGHVGILGQLASALLEPETSAALRTASSAGEVRALLDPA